MRFGSNRAITRFAWAIAGSLVDTHPHRTPALGYVARPWRAPGFHAFAWLALVLIAFAGCGTTRRVPARPDDDGDGYRSASCADNDCDGLTDGATLAAPALAVSADVCIDSLDLAWTGSQFGLAWTDAAGLLLQRIGLRE